MPLEVGLRYVAIERYGVFGTTIATRQPALRAPLRLSQGMARRAKPGGPASPGAGLPVSRNSTDCQKTNDGGVKHAAYPTPANSSGNHRNRGGCFPVSNENPTVVAGWTHCEKSSVRSMLLVPWAPAGGSHRDADANAIPLQNQARSRTTD